MNPGRWLGWLVPPDEREFVLGDLAECYGERPVRHAWALVQAAFSLRIAAARQAGPALPDSPLPNGAGFMSTFLSDLRYGIRQLIAHPGFTAIAMFTLALGIGATTAIFSVVNPVLFQSLPYPEPDRIVKVAERDKSGNDNGIGYATFEDLHNQSRSFAALAVTSGWQPTLQSAGEPERLNGQRVTGDFLSVFGIRPALGRDFTPQEQVRDQHRVAILSHRLWVRRFGGDPGILGKPITLGEFQYLIVGIMPASFENLVSPQSELWAPLAYNQSLPYACRTCHHLTQWGRLKPGVSLDEARRDLDVISGRLVAQYPTEYVAPGILVVPLRNFLTKNIRPALLALLGAVGFVLLIACANVSSLLLGRAMQREGEFAIRGALGARRSRVIRQLLTESILLALAGGVAGIGLAWAGVQAMASLAPPNLPRLSAIGINGPVLAFTAGLSILTGLLFGTLPAFATARPDLFSALRPGGRLTGQRSKRLARAILVGGEIALAVMLLVGAGLLMRSLERLLSVDPGFEPRNLLTMQVQTTGAKYNDNAPTWAFWDQALQAVRAVPGVELAGWTSQLPLGGNVDRYGVQIEGKLLGNPEDAPSGDRYAVTPDYLRTMKIPLIRGRTFTEADAANAPLVALVNEAFVRIGWGGADPIGSRVQMGGPKTPWRTVVGIVGNVHHVGLDEEQAPQFYIPETQWLGADGAMDLAVRTRGNPALLAAAVRQAIRSVDPTQPILNVATMEEVVSGTASQRRFSFVVFQVFAVVALLLAAAGIYGVLAGSVTERTRELGIRSALGASNGSLVRMVVRQGFGLTLTGMAVGAVGALGLSRFLAKMLFGVGTRDPVTFGAAAAVLLAVSLLACWAPAWRATRVSPLEALRSE